jgi:hypothetical protein
MSVEYDERYLAGIMLFNQRDYFEAHEVWESLWHDCPADERKFYQGLIKAAATLIHAHRGNWRGVRSLFVSARDAMLQYPKVHRGLNLAGFWDQMERCVCEMLGNTTPEEGLTFTLHKLPLIELSPPPDHWPDPAHYQE